MGTRQKVSLILLGLFLTFFVAMIVIVTVNFRDYGIKHAEERAKLTAEIVKGGLTAHMVNGMMDQRAYFLGQIENVENIDAIWIARSETVIKQHGEGFNNEIARDAMDKRVLKSGKMEKEILETASKSTLRVTIPFVASAFGTPNCLNCHDAQEGEVLGTVSMVIDVSDMRGSSLETVGAIAGIAILIMALVLLIVNKFLKPYVRIFYSIRDVMQSAYEGDYSARVDGGNLAESKAVAGMMNTLLEKLQQVFEEIDKKVYIFIQNKNQIRDKDPLISINNTIDQLSDIYKFKQTIENDEELEDVYKRIAHVLKGKFGLEDFTIVEADTVNGMKKVVYTVNGCHCNVEKGECRADRINAMVDSSIFDNTCSNFTSEGMQYICIPYSISNDLNLIITIVTKSEEESLRVRNLVGLIEDYVATAQPAIVSKKLMQILNKMARVDQLTGLFNRKYLDEFADTTIPQALRTGTPYGILMLDIDFFKMINDTYGHDAGDEAIRVISRVIKENTRKSDIAIRFGGEEFLVLLHNCNKDFITSVAEKIRNAFAEQRIFAGSESFSKTLSVGTSMFPDDSESIWKCIKFADIALYRAKEGGRNQVVNFDPSLLDASLKEQY